MKKQKPNKIGLKKMSRYGHAIANSPSNKINFGFIHSH